MKTTMKYLGCLLSLFLIISCSGSSSQQEKDTFTIQFNLDEDPEDVYTVGLINDMEVYQLDSKEVLFGEINKIVRHKDRIYLADNNKTKSVIVYDTSGRLVNTINQYGQGPEEYYQLTDVFVDPEKETLNVVCRLGRKILKYDLDGRELKEVVKLPKMFDNLSKTEWGYIGYMGNYDPDNFYAKNIWTVSEELNLIKGFMDIDPDWNSKTMGGIKHFSHYKNNNYYIYFLDNNIYTIDKSNISVLCSLDFGKYNWPEEKKDYKSYSEAGFEMKQSKILCIDFFQETDNHLLFYFHHQGQSRLGVYNKNTSQVHCTNLNGSNNEKYPLDFGTFIGMDENHIYTLIAASRIQTMLIGRNEYNDFEKMYPEQINRLRERFKGIEINEEDNPFLIVYSIN